jgi:hypothetical protein
MVDFSKFYDGHIGRGEGAITQKPEVGDYTDDDVSKPDGVLFRGPQAASSAELHGLDEHANEQYKGDGFEGKQKGDAGY